MEAAPPHITQEQTGRRHHVHSQPMGRLEPVCSGWQVGSRQQRGRTRTTWHRDRPSQLDVLRIRSRRAHRRHTLHNSGQRHSQRARTLLVSADVARDAALSGRQASCGATASADAQRLATQLDPRQLNPRSTQTEAHRDPSDPARPPAQRPDTCIGRTLTPAGLRGRSLRRAVYLDSGVAQRRQPVLDLVGRIHAHRPLRHGTYDYQIHSESARGIRRGVSTVHAHATALVQSSDGRADVAFSPDHDPRSEVSFSSTVVGGVRG